MSSTFDARGFVKDFEQSLNAKDAGRLLRHYAENAEVQDPSTPRPVRGKKAIEENFLHWSTAFSDLHFTVKDVYRSESGSKVAILLEGNARNTGPLQVAPGESAPATNRTVRLEIAEFLTIAGDGKVTKDETIFDMGSMMTQLGLMPGS